MNRRNLLKILGVSAVGVATVPLWMDAWNSDDLPSDTSEIKKDQELVLIEIVDTYIPADEIPGAKELEVDRFVLAMVTGCLEEDIQREFYQGFQELEKVTQEKYDSSFPALTNEQRIDCLTTLEAAEKDPDKKMNFVTFVKELTITGYMNSQYILENHMNYELVPARFHGSFPVEKSIYSNA